MGTIKKPAPAKKAAAKKVATKVSKTKVATEPAREVITYKAFDENLKCRDFQYKVGHTYTHDGEVIACESGFHSCTNPLDVLNYYELTSSRFAVVKAGGQIAKHGNDTKIASATIAIQAELKLPEFIKSAVAWLLDACKMGDNVQAASGDSSQLAASGDYSKLAASGDSSQLAASGYYSKLAASGDYSKLAASGDSSQLAASGYYSNLAASGDSSKLAASGYSSKLAASGDHSQLAASGDSSQLAASGYSSKLAASGYYSQLAASGKSSIAMASGLGSRAKAGENGAIALSRWVEAEKRYRVSVAYVGEDGIKPDVWYELDEAGAFAECDKE